MRAQLKSALFALAFATGVVLPTAARADSVNVVLTASTQSAAPGSIVTYSGTISAPFTNGAPIYIDGGDPTFAGPSDINVDASDLLNFLDALNPGSSVSGDLFTITVPSPETSGTYSGSVTVLGGSGFTSTDSIGQVNFSLNVASPASVTPEPLSYLLLATGIVGVCVLVRRQRALLS